MPILNHRNDSPDRALVVGKPGGQPVEVRTTCTVFGLPPNTLLWVTGDGVEELFDANVVGPTEVVLEPEALAAEAEAEDALPPNLPPVLPAAPPPPALPEPTQARPVRVSGLGRAVRFSSMEAAQRWATGELVTAKPGAVATITHTITNEVIEVRGEPRIEPAQEVDVVAAVTPTVPKEATLDPDLADPLVQAGQANPGLVV